MASRIVLGIVIIALLGAAGFFAMNYQIESHYDNGKLSYIKIVPRAKAEPGPTPPPPDAPAINNLPPPSNRPTFRVAAYNLGGLDEIKLSNPRIGEILSQSIRRFDLVALQGLRGKNQGVPVRLIEHLNAASGRQYDFATCPTQKRDGVEHYSGFLFDKAVVEVDRATVHFIEDPQRRFRRKPLVGLFRARATPAPFTFYLIAVDTDPEKPAAELDLLADVFRAVRDVVRPDGPSEDDVIMLGDFEADERHLSRLGNVPGITAAIGENFPTTVRGTKMADNLLFDRRAVVEFTGRAEVFDTMREFELTVQAAAEVSEHLPVWAEFSVFEGGPRGYVPRIK
ncbi:MAG: endonuclease/exonuclease/phosphatase [Pirellulales bacterium]|nr:endonuclease/exonuclease/phosphatase [Pirellulales bacterium]